MCTFICNKETITRSCAEIVNNSETLAIIVKLIS